MLLAIDIGGTAIKYAVIDRNLDIVDQHIMETAKKNQNIEITNQIEAIVSKSLKERNITGVGISSAGVVNSITGEIIYAGPTMPTYRGTNFKKYIEEKFLLPTTILNDVNAAVIGEKWLGSAKEFSNFLCMTIGTGIGGAVFMNNQLYCGEHFRAGEIGHSPFLKYQNKSYEQVASMSALLSRAEKELNFYGNGKQLFELAKQGDTLTYRLIDSWISDLVEGMLSFLCILDVDAVIVGGAVSYQGDFLIDKIKDQLSKKIIPSLVMPKIIAAALGNNAALFGAIRTLYDVENQLTFNSKENF